VAPERVRTAEVVAALSLATDLGMGLPFEHGLQSTVVALRLADRLGVDTETTRATYYGCLLFYIGCTADAATADRYFDDGALLAHFTPVMFGSPTETLAGILRALGEGSTPATRPFQVAGRLPGALRGHRRHLAAMCEVAQMLTDRLGLPPSVRALFDSLPERWDGKGVPRRLRGDGIPLPVRLIQVAQDAVLHRTLGGEEDAARVVRERAGRAFDPAVAALLADRADEILAPDAGSAWDETLAREPGPRLVLEGTRIDQALAAIGEFADLLSPHLTGHSAGVAELAADAAAGSGLADTDRVTVRRAGLVHDVGRVAVPARVWDRAGPLTPDEWERVRLHGYHTERVLGRSPFLAALARVAVPHHERLDGTGYHRGSTAAALPAPARLLAAADAYHAMTEPRPHRPALPPATAAAALGDEARAGRLDADCVAAVLAAAGQRAPRLSRPAGLTERETQVVVLLARGMQTKQVARALGISVKTADRHVQNAYAKMGVSTRAATTLFAMQHGLATWGELPIGGGGDRS
jgi:HD-GYP domain-containing protein (c-di-GMP phosphodiesterase class II)